MARLTVNRHARRVAALTRYPKTFLGTPTGKRTEQQWKDERAALERNIAKGGGR